MLLREIQLTEAPAAGAAAAPITEPVVDLALEQQVQSALNLWLPLKTPAQMPALLATIESVKPQVYEALGDLHYVHFARFLPSPDFSMLWVITTYDGSLHSYVMDFVAVMGDIFTALLQFIRDAPRLPVNKYPRDFVDFIDKHNMPRVGVWSAYKDVTVIDVLHATQRR
jgi:hypothetical protein